MENYKVEVCAYCVQSSLIAQDAGAHRIELCDNYFEGGTTPSAASIELARKLLKLTLHVIIRPRGGDFVYSDLEFKVMKRDIEIAKELGADGVVFGILKRDGSIDEDRVSELVKLSAPLSITFHRAFDVLKDPYTAAELLIEKGFDRILTSGQKQTAIEGKELIKHLINKFKNKIIFMPGSGITEDNIIDLKNYTNAKEYHLSAKSLVKRKMEYRNFDVNMSGQASISEFERYETDLDKVKEVINRLEQSHP